MKRFMLLFLIAIISLCVNGQAPNRKYGEYKYSHTINSNGSIEKSGTFPRIRPIVVTTNFGFIQSWASYMYMGVGGVWFNSAEFSWAGFKNGWYVYAYRIGPQYSYLLISSDFETIRIQEKFMNGMTDVYTHCDPNEKMNNAPTF